MIEGVLLVDRAITRHKEWLLEKPFSNGQAMIDLFLLANQQPASFKTQQRVITIEPGQVGWSVMGLADRWGWSRGKVNRTLARWEKDGMVRVEKDEHVPLITVINLMDYQSGLRRLLVSEPNPNGQPMDNERTTDGQAVSIEGERGKGVLKYSTEGIGKGNGTDNNHTDLVSLVHYCQQQGMPYTNDEIRTVFLEFTQDAVDGIWMTRSKVPRPVADWRAAVELRLSERRRWGDEKNGAKNPGLVSDSVATIEARKQREAMQRELKELEQQEEDDRQVDTAVFNATRRSRIKTLRQALKEAQ